MNTEECQHEWEPDGYNIDNYPQQSGRFIETRTPRVKCKNPLCAKVELRPAAAVAVPAA